MTDTVSTVLHSGQASPAPAVMERAGGSPLVREETPGPGQAEYADGFDVIGLIHGRRSRSGRAMALSPGRYLLLRPYLMELEPQLAPEWQPPAVG